LIKYQPHVDFPALSNKANPRQPFAIALQNVTDS
jgi:hypothetical protein